MASSFCPFCGQSVLFKVAIWSKILANFEKLRKFWEGYGHFWSLLAKKSGQLATFKIKSGQKKLQNGNKN